MGDILYGIRIYIEGDGMVYMVYIEISGGYSIIIGGSDEDIVYIIWVCMIILRNMLICEGIL